MRLLFAIPHYVRPGGEPDAGRSYASLAADPAPRVQALAAAIAALHQTFNARPCFIQHITKTALRHPPAEPSEIEIVVCTTGGHHILDRLPIEPRYYTHCLTSAEPLLLGFACHAVLHERLGRYDYYCYLEDDLIVADPWFFRKLEWFSRLAGPGKLLQPNRFEAGLNHLVSKVYVDGDVRPEATAMFQNVNDSGPITGEHLGTQVEFTRTSNPHSGCFFLNAEQMAHWAGRSHFTDHDSRFIGPLETAASLGIMRTFQVYRPAPRNANFLEVQHAGTGYMERLAAGDAP